MTMEARWNNQVIARSDETVIIENNHYFPVADVMAEFLRPSDYTSFCPWKGEAQYCSIVVGDVVNTNAAWFYPAPKDAAKQIKGHYAFWKGVDVVSV